MINQGGQQIGAIGLFRIDPSAKFSRYENSGVIPDKPATPILDFDNNGIVQGHVEGSNVNPILEMAKLITIVARLRKHQRRQREDRGHADRRHKDAGRNLVKSIT